MFWLCASFLAPKHGGLQGGLASDTKEIATPTATLINSFFTLPPLQQTLVNFFFEFAWGFFGVEKWRGFQVLSNFQGLRFVGNQAHKVLEKSG